MTYEIHALLIFIKTIHEIKTDIKNVIIPADAANSSLSPVAIYMAPQLPTAIFIANIKALIIFNAAPMSNLV